MAVADVPGSTAWAVRPAVVPAPKGRAGFGGALRSEFTKIRSTRSTYWTLLALMVITIGIGALASFAAAHKVDASGKYFDPTNRSLDGLYFGQLVIAALGALTITSEYSTGMIRTSLAVMPRRGVVFAAKAAAFGVVAFVAGMVTSFGAFFLGQALMSGPHINATLGQPNVLRAVIGGRLLRSAFMTFNVGRVRAAYPALADGYAYLDGAAGTQMPEPVIDAIAGAYRAGIGNSGGAFPASHRSDVITSECRRAVADLTGGVSQGVILGPNMTTLTYRLSRALAAGWGPGDEVVVTRLDHDANVRPWVQAAAAAKATVRWAEVLLPEGDLEVAQIAGLISERTRLVAVTAASNLIGTRPDVAAVTALAHEAGALAYVDGVHATPHGPVDVAELGADFYTTSAYKWCGPHVGAVVADPALLDSLVPDKLVPAPDYVPDRFEQGTLPFADLAGVAAAVEHLASLAGPAPASATRRERVLAGMAAAQAHEQELFAVLLGGLDAMDHVTTYGKAARRTATAYFTVAGLTPLQVAEHLAQHKINVWDGDNYAWELAGVLGLRATGGAVRAGLVHYNDRSDVDRLLAAVAELGR